MNITIDSTAAYFYWNQGASQHFKFTQMEFLTAFMISIFALVTFLIRACGLD